MSALSINKVEMPLTPPPSCRRLSELQLPSVVQFNVPSVNKFFLIHELPPLDPPELFVDAIKSNSRPPSLIPTVECIFVTEPGLAVLPRLLRWKVLGNSRDAKVSVYV